MAEWLVGFVWHAMVGLFCLGLLSLLVAIAHTIIITTINTIKYITRL